MLRQLSTIGLVCGVFLASWGCSSSDPGPGPGPSAGAPNGGSSSAGSAGSLGGSAAGSINVAGANAGTTSAGSSGAALGGGGGSAGSAGAAGAANPTCVPGTGTEAVGQKSVLDRKTCLTWTKARSTTNLTNKAAAKYCADLEQDGISNWRVPRPEELVTWPDLATDGTAYITGPIYVPTAGTEQDGCTGNSHSCNIAKYNDTSLTCAWQGVGFAGWVECVSGTAAAGTTAAAYAATSCSPCSGSLATFEETDCSAYAN